MAGPNAPAITENKTRQTTTAPGAATVAQPQEPLQRTSTQPAGTTPESMKDWIDLSLYMGPNAQSTDKLNITHRNGAPLVYFHADRTTESIARDKVASTVMKCDKFIKGYKGEGGNNAAAANTKKQIDAFMFAKPVPPATTPAFDGQKAADSLRLHAWGDGTPKNPPCSTCQQNLTSQGITKDKFQGNLDGENQKSLQEGLKDRLNQQDATGGAGDQSAWNNVFPGA